MEALLAVLGDGDAKLMTKARETHAHWHKHVVASGKGDGTVRQTLWPDHEVRSAWKLLNTFAVADRARPLESVEQAPAEMASDQVIDGSAPIAVMVRPVWRRVSFRLRMNPTPYMPLPGLVPLPELTRDAESEAA